MRTLLPILLVTSAVVVGTAAAGPAVDSSRSLGAGGVAVGRCDSDGFSFANRLDLAGNVTAVTVSGISLACAGGALKLTLADGAGTSIAGGGLSLPATGFTGGASVDVSPQPTATGLAAYHVAVLGP